MLKIVINIFNNKVILSSINVMDHHIYKHVNIFMVYMTILYLSLVLKCDHGIFWFLV